MTAPCAHPHPHPCAHPYAHPHDGRVPQATIDDQVRANAASRAFDDWGLSTLIDEIIETPVIPRDGCERLNGLAWLAAARLSGTGTLLSRVRAAALARLISPPNDALRVLDLQSIDGTAEIRTVLVAASASCCQSLVDLPPRLRYNAATSTLSPRSPLAASLRTQ